MRISFRNRAPSARMLVLLALLTFAPATVSAANLSATSAASQTPRHLDLQRLSLEAAAEYHAGRLESALTLSKEVAAVAQATFGDNDIRHAQALNNIAILEDMRGNIDAAAQTYARAIAIVETLGPEHSVQLSHLKNNLAAIALQQCRIGEAQSLYAASLALAKERFGSYHDETRAIRQNIDKLDHYLTGTATPEVSAQLNHMMSGCVG